MSSSKLKYLKEMKKKEIDLPTGIYSHYFFSFSTNCDKCQATVDKAFISPSREELRKLGGYLLPTKVFNDEGVRNF